MQKIKVLHIIKSLGRGGAEMLLPETIRLHNRDQFEFHCIYFLPWKDQLVESIKNVGGAVHCFRATNNLVILAQAFKIIRYAKTNSIDVIHCHLPWAGFVGRIVHLLSGTKVIYTEHNKQERYHWLTAVLNRITFNWQDLVVAVSEDVKGSIKDNIQSKIPMRTILNGVNTDRFNKSNYEDSSIREKLNISGDIPIIGNVAVFRTQKRLDLWLEEAQKIRNEIPNAYFILIGDGPTEDAVKRKIVELDLKEIVHCPGRLDEVRPYLAAMDIFMISSEFEGLPIALLEAMSMEVPVVSTNAGGIKEVIDHKQNGLLVEVDEVKLLSKGVISLLNDDPFRKKVAQNGRTTVLDQFSLIRMVHELEDAYIKIVNN